MSHKSITSVPNDILQEVPEILKREIEFHNDWADTTSIADVSVHESFESPMALENRFALSLMGDLKGKKLLDVGTGLGETAVYFALQGAEVTATDISPRMIEQARNLASHYQTEVEGIVCAAEELKLPDNHVDICYAANLLHHVVDRKRTLREMHRVLKPNGLVVTWDPLTYNPVINIYRRMADKVRTKDEKPLKFDIVQDFQEFFENVEHREFWLSALLIFIKYYVMDRIHPNQDRYWKRILKEGPSVQTWLVPLIVMDRHLIRLPLLNYMAWTILIFGRKGDKGLPNG